MSQTPFKDHFSGHADTYRQARPIYPSAFLMALCQSAPGRDCCWDVGCGNGQASVLLAGWFRTVIATDPSSTQIANAEAMPNIDYRVEPAEQSSLADRSVDFISVAQAYHWFDHDRFAREVRRVAKPGGVIAAYGYRHTQIAPDIDAWVAELYEPVLGADWPPERRHVDAALLDLPFPFRPISVPAHSLTLSWTVDQFLGYLESWSAMQRYRKRTGTDPLATRAPALRAMWGNGPRDVQWDLFARVGVVD
ncbi:SAM-dependent methyltransferase [Ahniella affigens]|uniref:SAM-dependent methyltransferase n=1 Tax=Ahniella affigens TaxID=2021234 RepID=A0A2P1PUI6_9GAMM|nr:class I SAM-dependent methyltransferase [Ahniella affigens]AVP98516.1 SAM-dependent methyltransferase [Ahniella affigens]